MEGSRSDALAGELAIRLVREGLESVMAPELASSIVFVALEQEGGQELPSSARELFRFVRGPLRAVLIKRAGESKTREGVQRIEELIGKAFQTGKPEPTFQTTMRLPSVSGPVAVMFLSGTAALGVRLRASLGGDRISVHVVGNLAKAAEGSRRVPPDMLVLDLEGLANVSSSEISDLAQALPDDTAIVLWAADSPQSAQAVKSLKKAFKHVVPIDRLAGIDPLLDFVKARQASPPRW